MSEDNMQDRSLCSNCKNAASCTFPKDRQKPSMYCEEYELDVCPPAKIAGTEKPILATPVKMKDEDSGKFIGLCRNCNNRKTCVFPKPEGGVWHCEEYQ